jgi:hypothetical protein
MGPQPSCVLSADNAGSTMNLGSFSVTVLCCCLSITPLSKLNLGCLHPVARVRSDDVGFNPSTQRYYHRLSSKYLFNCTQEAELIYT